LDSQNPNVIDLEQERAAKFCKAVFEALCDLEDLSWLDELSEFVDGLRRRHGYDAVNRCRLTYASSGSTPRPDEQYSSFDFSGGDSFFTKMDSLARRRLDQPTYRRIREDCGIKEQLP